MGVLIFMNIKISGQNESDNENSNNVNKSWNTGLAQKQINESHHLESLPKKHSIIS